MLLMLDQIPHLGDPRCGATRCKGTDPASVPGWEECSVPGRALSWDLDDVGLFGPAPYIWVCAPKAKQFTSKPHSLPV